MTDTPPPSRPLHQLLGFGRKVEPLQPSTPAQAPPPAFAPPPEPEPPAAEPGEPEGYRAFTPARVREYCTEIRMFGRLGESEVHLVPLSHFAHATLDGSTHLVLKYATTSFIIEGRGLYQLVQLMKRGPVSIIQQWHPSMPEPAGDAPKITRITEVSPEMAAAQEAAMRSERAPEIGRTTP